MRRLVWVVGRPAAVGTCPRRVPSRTDRVLQRLAELEEDGAVFVGALVVRILLVKGGLAGAAGRPHLERRHLDLAEVAVALEVADRVAAPVVDQDGELVRGRRLLLARVRAVVRVGEQQPRAAADLKREEKGRDERGGSWAVGRPLRAAASETRPTWMLA